MKTGGFYHSEASGNCKSGKEAKLKAEQDLLENSSGSKQRRVAVNNTICKRERKKRELKKRKNGRERQA